MRFRHVHLPILIAATLIAPRLASAQVIVAVGGDADQATRATMTEAVSNELRDQRAEVSQHPLSAADVDGVITCLSREASQECTARFMSTTKASRAVVMRVANYRGETTIYGWIVATSGTILVGNQRACEGCKGPQLAKSSRALLVNLLKDVETRTMPTRLAVRSTPPGARVELDGRIVGVTPLEHVVYSGKHRLVFYLHGYEPSIHEREALAGETTTVEADLKPTFSGIKEPVGGGTKHESRPFPWRPWSLVGAGALVAAGGIALVAIDQDSGGRPYRLEYRDTSAAGFAGLGVGVAAATIGAIWLWRDRTQTEPQRGLTMTADSRSASLGYAGAF
jgi:hypothetical protein